MAGRAHNGADSASAGNAHASTAAVTGAGALGWMRLTTSGAPTRCWQHDTGAAMGQPWFMVRQQAAMSRNVGCRAAGAGVAAHQGATMRNKHRIPAQPGLRRRAIELRLPPPCPPPQPWLKMKAMAWARRALPMLLILGVGVVCLGPGLMIMRPLPCGPLPGTHRCCLVAHPAPALVAPVVTAAPAAGAALPPVAIRVPSANDTRTRRPAATTSPPATPRLLTTLRV